MRIRDATLCSPLKVSQRFGRKCCHDDRCPLRVGFRLGLLFVAFKWTVRRYILEIKCLREADYMQIMLGNGAEANNDNQCNADLTESSGKP
jgi:hypothetical protein